MSLLKINFAGLISLMTLTLMKKILIWEEMLRKTVMIMNEL